MSDDFVKNQHYIPQGYLRFFSNKKDQIWVYDKFTKRKFQTNVRNVGSEQTFYDSSTIEKITGDRQFIEKHLRPIESKYSEVCGILIRNLNSGKFKSISQSVRHFLSVYLVVQMLRTKEQRIALTQQAETMISIIRQRCIKDGVRPPTIEEVTGGLTVDQASREVHNATLLNGKEIKNISLILYRHIWIIQEAYREEQFITSDHPFVKTPHIKHSWRSMSGIASKGIEIMCPISPRYMLTLLDRDYFSELSKLNGGRFKLHCSENMVYNNQFQIYQSNRFVFSQDGNFDFVDKVLNEEPIHGNPNKIRVATNHDEALGRADGVHKFPL